MNGASSYDPAGGTIFFPASGYRGNSSGALSYVGGGGYYWSPVPYSTNLGRYLSFVSTGVYPLNYNGRSYGFAVRPLQE